MDWGFVEVETENGAKFKIACFAMICHFCGKRYIAKDAMAHHSVYQRGDLKT
ncbi:MAG: hypothetical protein IJT80_07865 [Lachnospiraceae bacterium]|nr:hypothetical protein [Lachnospiraceae bacterium]